GLARIPTARLPTLIAQWHCWAACLAYRCGGSRGFAPRSRAPGSRAILNMPSGGRSCSTCKSRSYFLTQLEICNIVAPVEAEFNSLEAKVEQFVAVCERLRAENSELRQQLAAAQRDAKLLNEKIDGAKSKLEGLLNRLPG